VYKLSLSAKKSNLKKSDPADSARTDEETQRQGVQVSTLRICQVENGTD